VNEYCIFGMMNGHAGKLNCHVAHM